MKKIGILTSNRHDSFVHGICQWIIKKGCHPVIIYEQDLFDNQSFYLKVGLNNIGIKITTNDNFFIDFDEISVFYRRSWHHEIFFVENEVDFFCKKEIQALRDYVLFRIMQVNKLIGKCTLDSALKIRHLDTAVQVGLDIPESIIINNLKSFDKSSFLTINKSINSNYFKKENEKMYSNYTNNISRNMLPTKFFPSLFQNKLEKKYELRIFVFLDKMYCVSYVDKYNTNEIDVRLKIANNVIETYPFNLPKVIKEKILKMLHLLSIETASIDMVVDTDDAYYFLDLNPFGQASMVTKTCFYQVEMEIAETLINY
jgi:hypothetical protein